MAWKGGIPFLGGPLPGGTAGSILYVGTGGVIAEKNPGLTFDGTTFTVEDSTASPDGFVIDTSVGGATFNLPGASRARTGQVLIEGNLNAPSTSYAVEPLFRINVLNFDSNAVVMDVWRSDGAVNLFRLDVDGDLTVGTSITAGTLIISGSTARAYINLNANYGLFFGTYQPTDTRRSQVWFGEDGTQYTGKTPASNQNYDQVNIRREWDMSSTYTVDGYLLRLTDAITNSAGGTRGYLNAGDIFLLDENGDVVSTGDATFADLTADSVTTPNLSFAVDTDRYGFCDRTETSISFNDSTYVFTLTDAGSGWTYYRAGIKYTISGNKTVTLAGSPPTADNYYIYIDATDGTLTASTSAWTLLDTKVVVAMVAWDNALTPKYHLADERHECLIDRRMHYYEHTLEGTKLLTRGGLTGYTIGSDIDSNKVFGIDASSIADEDFIISLAALTKPNGSDQAYTTVYRDGASSYVWGTSNVPFRYSGTYIYYDDYDGVGAGIVTGQNNKFYNSYLLFTNFADGDARYIILDGRAEYSTLIAAQTETPEAFELGGWPIHESVFAYQLTWKALAANSSSGQVTLEAVKVLNIGASSSVVPITSGDHNSLGGLQGGTTDEYYHLTAAELAGLGAAGADTQVIYNDGGSYAGDSALTWDKTNDVLTMGEFRAASQPSFFVHVGTFANNVTGDGTTYTMAYDTEITDIGSNFNTGTYTFTAPVTGKYIFMAQPFFNNILAAHNVHVHAIATSNRNYNFISVRGLAESQQVKALFCIADMDTNDTATVTVNIAGSTKTVDVSNNTTTCYWTGALLH